jgi:hypothetical protein
MHVVAELHQCQHHSVRQTDAPWLHHYNRRLRLESKSSVCNCVALFAVKQLSWKNMPRDSTSSTILFRVVNTTLLICEHLQSIFAYFVVSVIYLVRPAVDRYTYIYYIFSLVHSLQRLWKLPHFIQGSGFRCITTCNIDRFFEIFLSHRWRIEYCHVQLSEQFQYHAFLTLVSNNVAAPFFFPSITKLRLM